MRFVSFRLLLAVAIIVLVVVAVAPPTLDATRPPAPEILQRQFPISGRARLVLQNTRGDITIQTWPRAAIELKAQKTADTDEDLSAIRIDINATTDSVSIASRAPVGGRMPRTRVDYLLRVPADTDLKLIETARGRIEIAGISGRAILRVETGALRIAEFSGTLDAMATSGEIDAVLARIEPDAAVKLETFNGDIRLRLPRGAAPHLEVRTLNGAVKSELPLNVEDPFGPRVAHEPGGQGSPFISLVSITGDIHIGRR